MIASALPAVRQVGRDTTAVARSRRKPRERRKYRPRDGRPSAVHRIRSCTLRPGRWSTTDSAVMPHGEPWQDTRHARYDCRSWSVRTPTTIKPASPAALPTSGHELMSTLWNE
jgi:hypothetical protein